MLQEKYLLLPPRQRSVPVLLQTENNMLHISLTVVLLIKLQFLSIDSFIRKLITKTHTFIKQLPER